MTCDICGAECVDLIETNGIYRCQECHERALLWGLEEDYDEEG